MRFSFARAGRRLLRRIPDVSSWVVVDEPLNWEADSQHLFEPPRREAATTSANNPAAPAYENRNAHLLQLIPANYTLEMRTQGTELVHTSLVVFIDRYRLTSRRIQHTAFAIREIFNILDIGLQEALVLSLNPRRSELACISRQVSGAIKL